MAKGNSSYIKTTAFLGLNRKAVGNEGEFFDCENVISDNYPAITTAPGYDTVETEKENIQAVFKISDSGFCGAANGEVFWNGEKIGEVGKDSEITYLFQQDVLYIYEKQADGWTWTWIYDPDEDESKMKVLDEVDTYNELYIGKATADDDGSYIYVIGVPNSSANISKVFLNRFETKQEIIVYGTEDRELVMTYPETRYVKPKKAAYCKVISTNPDSYQSYLSINNDRLRGIAVKFYEEDGETRSRANYDAGENEDTIYPVRVFKKIVPQMCKPILCQNRAWSGSADGSTIIISAWGDAGDFYLYDDLKDGSAYIEVSTEGKFSGFFKYNDSVLAFKKNSITVIYGDTPSDFAIGKEIDGVGCSDIDSAKVADGVLYFCGSDGFYAYSGGQPQFISPKLNARYIKCKAFVLNGKYYAEGTGENGESEILVYDVRQGIWLKEAAQGINGVLETENGIYIYNQDGVKKAKTLYEAENDTQEWFFESTDIYENVMEKKGIQEIFIRAKLEKDSIMTVYTINSEQCKEKHKEFYGSGTIKTYRVPVRFEKDEAYRYRIEGKGAAIIYGIERKVSAGGRNIGEI